MPGSPVGPAVDTGAAADVTATGATLTGTVRPNGAPPAVTFEYGTTAELRQGRRPRAATSGAVSAALTGLTPLTEYHYRLVATRDGRRSEGADQTFVTPREDVVAPPPADGVQKLVILKSQEAHGEPRGLFWRQDRLRDQRPGRLRDRDRARARARRSPAGRIKAVAGATRT